MERLDTLFMNHNLITDLGSGFFEGMPKLTSLSLNYNKIENVKEGAFSGLEGKAVLVTVWYTITCIQQIEKSTASRLPDFKDI